MKRSIVALAAILAIAAGSVARADDDGRSAPAGITPTTMQFAHLFALHAKATGKLDPHLAHTEVETDAFKADSLTGTQTEYRSGDDFRVDTVLGSFHESSGKLKGKQWEHNRNGLTRFISATQTRDDVNASLLRAGAASPYVHLLGVVQNPKPAYVVQIDPPGGRMEYLYFDAATYLLVRRDEAVEGRRVTYTYDDFRTTNGLQEPWHVHRTDGLHGTDEDWTIQSLAYGGVVAPENLAVPPSATTLAMNGDRVALPAKISGDRIILTVQMGSHKVNLQMDSGASGILLNRAVADATGVQSFGEMEEQTAGTYTASEALIPKITIGDAVMTNIAAETSPFVERSFDGSYVAGLIGYDFIAGAVMHVDYYGGTVEALNPASFKPPANAIALPIALDDGVPIIVAHIGNAIGKRFIVDTGADRSMIFSGFAHAHPGDVADQGLGESMTAAYPFIGNIFGVGGTVDVRPVQVPSLKIASITLPDWLFDVSQNAPAFEGEDYDGLIGQDVLRNFDVYFDYSKTMMYLVPNERYRQRWGSG